MDDPIDMGNVRLFLLDLYLESGRWDKALRILQRKAPVQGGPRSASETVTPQHTHTFDLRVWNNKDSSHVCLTFS